MSNPRFPLEGLLRPPYEWVSSLALGLSGGLGLSGLFMPVSLEAISMSSAVLVLGLWRTYQGFYIVRYRRHLGRLPAYALSSADWPRLSKALFLGRGFLWEARHVQRLRDCYQSRFAAFVPRVEQSPLGGNPYLHGVELKEQSVGLPLSERVGHTLVLGTTRVGKTRLLEILAAQAIARGEVVIVFDPKGDVALLRRLYAEAERAGRLADLRIFHLGFPKSSCRYNPIGDFARVTEAANRLT